MTSASGSDDVRVIIALNKKESEFTIKSEKSGVAICEPIGVRSIVDLQTAPCTSGDGEMLTLHLDSKAVITVASEE
jgi:hypothetical protein